MLILIALVIGAGFLPDKIEGVICYDCARVRGCFPQNQPKTVDCSNDGRNIEYCYKSLQSSRQTEKGCVTQSDKHEAECALSSPYLNNGCFNPFQFNDVIEPCIERKRYYRSTEEKNVSVPGEGGKGRGAKGSGNRITCYCKGHLCNDGEVGLFDSVTTVAPDPFNCYFCSDKDECNNKKDSQTDVKHCPIPYCMTMREIPRSKSSSGNAVVYRGCAPWSNEALDSSLGLQGSIDRVLKCYKGLKEGCRHSKRVETCLDEISPSIHESISRTFYHGESFEECLCEGDLCNFDTTEAGGVDGATGVSFRTVVLSFILSQVIFFLLE